MTTSRSAPGLLHVALEDLHAGKIVQAQRLPDLAAKCSDACLVDLVRREAVRVTDQANRIREAGVNVAEPKNLWMTGILDDAERDTRQTQPGRLLDIALIGAFRKAKAAEIVSSETAMALAGVLGTGDLLTLIAAHRAEEMETDRQLRERLAALSEGAPARGS